MAEVTIKDLRQRHVEEFQRARRSIRNGQAEFNPQTYGDALVGFAAALTKQKLEGPEFGAVLARYVDGLLALHERSEDLTGVELGGNIVRAAARCGWFEDLEEDDVDDLRAWEVDQLSDEIITLYNEALTVPKN